MPSSWGNTECSIHRVQHTPKIVCRPFILTISSWPLNVASASGVPPYRSTTTSQFSIRASKVKTPCHISPVASWLTDELSPGAPSIDRLQLLVQSRSITTSKCIFKLARSRPPSAFPNSLDHGLQVYLQTSSIMASKCISKLARSRPPQVHLQIRSITISQCISKFTRSRPPSVSLNSLDHGLGVYLWVHSTSASKCISKLAQSRPPSASLSSLNLGLQLDLQTRSITTSECISEFTLTSSSGAPRIADNHRVLPVQIYCV